MVADVDNDGNAEIIFVHNNWVEHATRATTSPNGTWNPGDALDSLPAGENDVDIDSLRTASRARRPSDTWVARAPHLNQHSYT